MYILITNNLLFVFVDITLLHIIFSICLYLRFTYSVEALIITVLFVIFYFAIVDAL